MKSLTTERIRQYRGLLIAWSNRPKWLRQEASDTLYTVVTTTAIGLKVKAQRRRHNYARIRLPTVPPLYGRGAYAALNKRCRWCQRTVSEKGRRVWHELCLPAYWAATGNQQAVAGHLRQAYRRQNDGQDPPCQACGITPRQAAAEARQVRQEAQSLMDQGPPQEAEDASARAAHFRKRSQEFTRLMEHAHMMTQFELDHRDALSVAWASNSERRLLRALTVENLQWLCHSCHAEKTADDRRRMNNLIAGRPENWTPPPTKPPDPSVQPPLWTD